MPDKKVKKKQVNNNHASKASVSKGAHGAKQDKVAEMRAWRLEMKEARKRKKLEIRQQGNKQPRQAKTESAESDAGNAQIKSRDVQTKHGKKRHGYDDDEEKEVPKKAKKAKPVSHDDCVAAADLTSDPEAFKIVVAGLPLTVDEKILRRDFSECGEILNLRLLRHRDTGASRGIAFISFTGQAALDDALKYNGDDYGGRSLVVQIAKKTSRADAGEGKPEKRIGKAEGKESRPGLVERPVGCKTVILKGLAYSVTEADLAKSFESCDGGPTNIDILTDKETGASRGIAFLDFNTESAVDDAIKLNGTELKGRRFRMDFVAPREKAKGPGMKPAGCCSILVKGLAYSVTEKELRKAFKAHGCRPVNVRIILDKATGESRGMGFVDFDDSAVVDEAIKLHGTDLKGRSLILDYASTAKSGDNKEGTSGKVKDKAKVPAKKPEGCTSIVLKGLAESVTEKLLMKTFKACDGGPRNVNLVLDKDTGERSGMAFVNFSTEAAVDEAMAFNGTDLKGQNLVIGYVKPRAKPREKK